MSWLTEIHPTTPTHILKMEGKSSAMLNFIFMLATTEPIEEDMDWWAVRLMTMSWS